MTSRDLVTLSFESKNDYNSNLEKLISLIQETPYNAIVVAPEVCLTNFDYENMAIAAEFTQKAIEELYSILEDRYLFFTTIDRLHDDYVNEAKVLHNYKIIHTQAKAKLFRLGNETQHFRKGSEDEITFINIDGIKFAILICFELRFKELWTQIEGADVVAIPSQWGKTRSEAYETLTRALAIMNQCYVVASDMRNLDTTGRSSITTPFGLQSFVEGETLTKPYDRKKIIKIRRQLDVGIEW
ncbi:MAG: carbon-nitrogen hydrolase family protein [Helicobacteraceae bacterium]|nr:carbon-nitrogen hydrolase family protein [Helicobacteraceae bacterium]